MKDRLDRWRAFSCGICLLQVCFFVFSPGERHSISRRPSPSKGTGTIEQQCCQCLVYLLRKAATGEDAEEQSLGGVRISKRLCFVFCVHLMDDPSHLGLTAITFWFSDPILSSDM